MASDAQANGNRRNILSPLPIYTLSPDLLEKIWVRNQLPVEDIQKIQAFAKEQKALVETTLLNNTIIDEISELSMEEFAKYPMHLSLANAFFENDIPYTYDEYVEHLNLTKEFAKNHTNYSVQDTTSQTFRNIQIHILSGKYVMISKVKTPVIHFVIRHPKMVNALESFIAPVME